MVLNTQYVEILRWFCIFCFSISNKNAWTNVIQFVFHAAVTAT